MTLRRQTKVTDMSQKEQVLFINGQSPHVAEVFGNMKPPGFDAAWIPANLGVEEQKRAIAKAAYVVLHPATLSADLLHAGQSLRLVQLLTAGYDKVDLKTAAELGIPVATNGGANAWALAEHPFLALSNVLLTPHTAGHSYEGWARRSAFAWQNIQRVAAGEAPRSLARAEEG